MGISPLDRADDREFFPIETGQAEDHRLICLRPAAKFHHACVRIVGFVAAVTQPAQALDHGRPRRGASDQHALPLGRVTGRLTPDIPLRSPSEFPESDPMCIIPHDWRYAIWAGRFRNLSKIPAAPTVGRHYPAAIVTRKVHEIADRVGKPSAERANRHGRTTQDGKHAPPQPFRARHVKRAFEIDEMMRRVRRAVRDYPKAVLFELADDGFGSPFQILVACVITIRTLEEVSLPAARRLFNVAHDPESVADLAREKIDQLIRPYTFHEPKSRTIHAIAQRIIDEFGGQTPCDFETLTSFAGVGPKCANLAIGIACGKPRGIPVDIHVHRVVNRWGYVAASTPEKTMAQLEGKLPRKYWLEINKLMVPFGKHICTGRQPHCSTCPVLEFCRQVGVTDHR